jgi:putative peptidoglycan lipid II flippase
MIAKKIFFSNIIQVFNTAANFALGLLLAYYFGATKEMDAFVAAMNLVFFLNTLVLTAQSSVFIPFITKIDSEENRSTMISAILKFNFVLFFFIALLFFIGAPQIAHLITPGIGEAYKIKVAWLIRIFCGTLLSGNVIAIGYAMLDYNFRFEHRFLIQLCQILGSIVMLVLLAPFCGIYGAAMALLSGNVISFLLVFRFLKRNGLNAARVAFPVNQLKSYVVLMLPTLFSASFVWMIKYIEIFAASFQKVGSLAYLGYCQRIEGGTSVIATVVCAICYPLFSKLIQAGKKEEFLVKLYSGFQLIATIVLCLVAFLMLFSHEIIQLLFQHGNFNPSNTATLSRALCLYGFVFIGAPFGTYLANVFFVYSKTGIAMWCSIGATLMQILSIFCLVHFMGFYGIVLAASIGFLTGNILQTVFLRKIIPDYRLKKMLGAIRSPLTAVVASSLVILSIKMVFPSFGHGFLLRTAYVSTMFFFYIMLYFSLNMMLKTPVVIENFEKLKSRFLLFLKNQYSL